MIKIMLRDGTDSGAYIEGDFQMMSAANESGVESGVVYGGPAYSVNGHKTHGEWVAIPITSVLWVAHITASCERCSKGAIGECDEHNPPALPLINAMADRLERCSDALDGARGEGTSGAETYRMLEVARKWANYKGGLSDDDTVG